MSATGDFLHRYFNLGFYGATEPGSGRVSESMVELAPYRPTGEIDRRGLARPNAAWDLPFPSWGPAGPPRPAASASTTKSRVLIWGVGVALLFLLGASIALLRSPTGIARAVVHALPVIGLVLGVLVTIWALATAVQWLRVLENRLSCGLA